MLILVLVPAIGIAAINCNPGNYKGKLWSVVSDLNGKTGTLGVRKEGERCILNFKTEGSNEIWELSGNTLIQKEFDNNGNITQQYGATLQGDKYLINCKDRAKNDCDGGVNSRNYWQIRTTPNEIVYTVYGVGSGKKYDAKAVAAKRHEFSFKMERARKNK